MVCGGGGHPCRLPFVARMSQAGRKHDASTGRGCSGGGGWFPLSGPHTPQVGYFTSVSCGPMSPRPPPVRRRIGPCLLAFFPWRVGLLCSLFFFSTARCPSLPLTRRSVLCPPRMSPRRLLAVLAPFLGGWGRRGWGKGGRPRCPSSGVSTSQARCRHEAQHLSLCRGPGGCRVAPVVALPTLRSDPRGPPLLGLARRVLPMGTIAWSVPHPLSAASTPCRFVLGGGGAVRPSLPASPTLGGAGVCGGGGHVVSPS